MIPEKGATFVNCDGMPAHLNLRVIRNEWEFKWVGNPADRADRIPYSDEARLALGTRHRVLKRLSKFEISMHSVLLSLIIGLRSIYCHHHSDRIGHESIVQ